MQLNSNQNILFFFSTTLIGGAETNILKISRELTKSNYKVFWCFLADIGPLLESVDFELSGVQETKLFYKNPIEFYKNYKNFIQKNKIDVVLNFGLRVEIISRLFSKRLGIKRVISNIRSTDDWRKWHHILIDKITQPAVDMWVSNSEAGKMSFHRREGIPLDKIVVIYNFFENPDSSYCADNNSESESLRIGVLANITVEKGYLDLIFISQKLNELNVQHKFIYAGHDRIGGAFERLISENKLNDHFEYLGNINNKGAFFSKIDVFLLPSYLEGMPTVLLEAMAFKKPIVSTIAGGIPEIIRSRENGYICAPGDISCLTESILKAKLNSKSIVGTYESRLKEFNKDYIMQKWIKIISNPPLNSKVKPSN